jgi:light-regulated signal transduction histidine kinase (bacteriophytochrome)
MIGTGNVEATEIYSERERQAANVTATSDLDLKRQTPDQFRKRVKETFPDLILPEGKLLRWRGIEALEILRRQGLDIPMILGGHNQEEESAQEELAKKLIELARSNADLEQFANVASHDLQEPLRMVSTYTELIAEQYSGKLDAKADKYIHYAVDGSRRMSTLIRDLLEFARAGKAEGHLRNCDSEEVVKQVIADLQVTIDETHAVVTFEHLPVVMARPVGLRQVFQNLIGNAIKFHDGKPPSIHVSAEIKERVWVFSVIDNGISIAPENTQKIFAIFQRLHTREEYPGNGIGLAICKKIVEQHGGTIWMEPNATPGATFKFTWPASILNKSGNDSCQAIGL